MSVDHSIQKDRFISLSFVDLKDLIDLLAPVSALGDLDEMKKNVEMLVPGIQCIDIYVKHEGWSFTVEPRADGDSTWLTETDLADLIYRLEHVNPTTYTALTREVQERLPVLLQMAMAATRRDGTEDATA